MSERGNSLGGGLSAGAAKRLFAALRAGRFLDYRLVIDVSVMM